MTSTNGEYKPPTENLPIFDNSVFSYWDGFLTLREFYKFIYSQIIGIYASLAGTNTFTGLNVFSQTILGNIDSSDRVLIENNTVPEGIYYLALSDTFGYTSLKGYTSFTYTESTNNINCNTTSSTLSTSSLKLLISPNNDDTPYPITFTYISAGTYYDNYYNSTFTFNPNSNTLTCVNFNGNATSSTTSITSTNSNNILVTSNNTNATYYLPFVKTSGTNNKPLFIDDTTTPLTYNPNTSTLTALFFSGNSSTASTATNTVNIMVTSNDTNATCYLPFVKTSGTANKPLFIDDTSTPLTYNPGTGLLQTTGIQILNKNILSNSLIITSNYTLTTSSPEYIFIISSDIGYTINLPSLTNANIGLKFSISCNTPTLTQIIAPFNVGIYGNLEYNHYTYINMSSNTNLTGLVCANFVEIVYMGIGSDYGKSWAIIGGSADVYARDNNTFSGDTNTFISNMIIQDDDISTAKTFTIKPTITNFENSLISPNISIVNFNNTEVNFNNDYTVMNCDDLYFTSPTTEFGDRIIGTIPPSVVPSTISFTNYQIDYTNQIINYSNPSELTQIITYSNTTIDYNNPSGGNQTITYNNSYNKFSNNLYERDQRIGSYFVIDIDTSPFTIVTPYINTYAFTTYYCHSDMTVVLPTASNSLLGMSINFIRLVDDDFGSSAYKLLSSDTNVSISGNNDNIILEIGEWTTSIICSYIHSVPNTIAYGWVRVYKT